MHVQVVIYDRGMMGEQEYIDLAYQIAPSVATAPGLLAAVWLDGSETGAYGGIMFWEDAGSMERFTNSNLFASAFGRFGDVLIANAGVLENVTQMTQPAMQVVPPRMAKGAEALEGQTSPLEIGEAGVSRRRASSAKRLTAKKPATKKAATAQKPAAKKAAAKRPPAAKKAATARKPSAAGRRSAKATSPAKQKASRAGSARAKPKAKAGGATRSR